MFARTILAFGSESGNAARLCERLLARLKGRSPKGKWFSPVKSRSPEIICQPLNDLNLANLSADDLLLVITSTFGDGDPPGNAKAFAAQLSAMPKVTPFQFAVFGMGDVAYPKFCQFGKDLDATLEEKGARRLINRVDADLNYQYFFSRWENYVLGIFDGKIQNGLDLKLQVKRYSEHHPYSATVNTVNRFPNDPEDVHHIVLDIRNSGIHYRVGDLLYVVPDDDKELYLALADWFGPNEDISSLAGKELRILGKSLLRKLAAASGNIALKNNLKIKNRAALADYLYERDLLDVLKDCGDPGFISVSALAKILPSRKARAYIIASCGVAEGGYGNSLHLCVRDVAYHAFGRNHNGAASHRLRRAQAGDKFNIFVRSDPGFRLDTEQTSPVIMIGEGVGTAPYIGFLEAISNTSVNRETILLDISQYGSQKHVYQFGHARQLRVETLCRLKLCP
ncbi:MAG: flavodoxin domain-containing protein, partial [Cyanobacteria bacterium P01_F01_bin.153]